MDVREPIHFGRKTLAEGAVCFGCALAVLAGIAIALQWLSSLL